MGYVSVAVVFPYDRSDRKRSQAIVDDRREQNLVLFSVIVRDRSQTITMDCKRSAIPGKPGFNLHVFDNDLKPHNSVDCVKMLLLGQNWLLHFFVSKNSPSHGCPPYSGLGLVQLL